MTKIQAMGLVSDLLRKERVGYHLETRMSADGNLVALEDVDCIHLTWFLDNALRELAGCLHVLRWVAGYPRVS